MSHGGTEARPIARRVFNFDNNDLAQAREGILELWATNEGFSITPCRHDEEGIPGLDCWFSPIGQAQGKHGQRWAGVGEAERSSEFFRFTRFEASRKSGKILDKPSLTRII